MMAFDLICSIFAYLPALKEIHIEEFMQLNGELNGCL